MIKKVIGKTWLNLRFFDKTLFKQVIHTRKFHSDHVTTKDNSIKFFSQIFNRVSNFISIFSQYISTILVEGLTQKYFPKISNAQTFNEAFKVIFFLN